MFETEILIVGAGISGLTFANLTQSAGESFMLLEARNRIGGRAFTISDHYKGKSILCDIGPSWIWPGQNYVLNALSDLGIETFKQYDQGELCYELLDKGLVKTKTFSPMSGSFRIKGGLRSLLEGLSRDIKNLHLEHVVKSVKLVNDDILVKCDCPTGLKEIKAKKVIFAIPPRLVVGINFSPNLSEDTLEQLKEIPTWMAGHAKFFAIYDSPFWREQGFSGSVLSQIGPLTEVHDSSPFNAETFSLFGFIGYNAQTRLNLEEKKIVSNSIQQLVRIFGPKAQNPIKTYYLDWNKEIFTASALDAGPQAKHFYRGQKIQLDKAFRNKIFFISSEMSPRNSGLVEGAFEMAYLTANQ